MSRFKISIPTSDIPMDIWADIVHAEEPLLHELDTMPMNHLNVLIAMDELFSAVHGCKLPLRRAKGHLLLEWAPPVSAYWYSTAQLLKMHRHLLHSSATQLMNLLQRANPKVLPLKTRSFHNEVSRSCHACHVYTSKPIKFQLRNVDDILFNQEIRRSTSEFRIAMSVHAMNTTRDPNGLVPATPVLRNTPVIPHLDQASNYVFDRGKDNSFHRSCSWNLKHCSTFLPATRRPRSDI
jgi:hypothetical protein